MRDDLKGKIDNEGNISIDELIKDYDLGPDEGITDHDEMCISQASKLLQIGYLEFETAGYATAYKKDNEIYYYVSDGETTMHKFLLKCHEANIYPTPVKYYCKRYDLLEDTEDDIKRKFRTETAWKLKEAYPPLYFEAVEKLTAQFNDNQAFYLLKEMSEQLDGCFDISQLNLFGSLLEMMLKGRLLNEPGYILLNEWLQNEYEKLAIEPIASGQYKRTFAGFAYEKPNGQIGYFLDAFAYMATEKQADFISRGYVVTPILQKSYYADAFQGLTESRAQFKAELEHYLGDNYIRLMKLIKSLDPCVDTALYREYYEKVKETGSKQALAAITYYGNLWNIDLKNM